MKKAITTLKSILLVAFLFTVTHANANIIGIGMDYMLPGNYDSRGMGGTVKFEDALLRQSNFIAAIGFNSYQPQLSSSFIYLSSALRFEETVRVGLRTIPIHVGVKHYLGSKNKGFYGQMQLGATALTLTRTMESRTNNTLETTKNDFSFTRLSARTGMGYKLPFGLDFSVYYNHIFTSDALSNAGIRVGYDFELSK